MYEVNSKLEVVSNNWRQIGIYFQGFSDKGSLRYDIIDENVKVGNRIARIYIIPAKKTIKCFQGKYRKLTFKWSDGIDGNSPHLLIEKVLNFIMW